MGKPWSWYVAKKKRNFTCDRKLTYEIAWADVDMFHNRLRPGKLNQIRILACQQCRELSGPSNQFVEISSLERAIRGTAPELDFTIAELTAALETKGDPSNGGGIFRQTSDTSGRNVVLYESDDAAAAASAAATAAAVAGHGPFPVGEIGSPGLAGAVPFRQQPPLGHARHLGSSPATAGFASFG